MKNPLRIALLGTSLLLVFAFTTNSGLSGENPLGQKQAPPAPYLVGAYPYLGSDYESRPAVVSSVASDAAEKFRVTKVGVRNNSSSPIVGVRLAWYMSKSADLSHPFATDKKSVLATGETPRISLPSKVFPRKHGAISQIIVSFEEAHKQLRASNKNPVGRFRIEVAAVEVFFDDGSSWKADQAYPTADTAKFPAMKIAFVRTPPPQYCPVTECSWNGAFYECAGSLFQTACLNCFTNCCNSLCSDPPVCDRCN
jgi:hypothetical protein